MVDWDKDKEGEDGGGESVSEKQGDGEEEK